MKYSVEIYIPGKKEFSGVFSGLSLESASRKVNDNVSITGEWGLKLSSSAVFCEIKEMPADDKLMYWCDESEGAYALVSCE